MKRLLFLGLSTLVASTSFGQRSASGPTENPRQWAGFEPIASSPFMPNLGAMAKTTGVPFYTETFAGGTNTTLPNGWVGTGNSLFPNGWKWRNVATTGAYSIGTIASTTAANGWVVFDSDSLGTLSAATPIEGYLTSPVISCAGHSSVGLTFQEKFRKYQDSCFVDVSTNNFATFTRFPVGVNNALASTLSTANPETVSINITSVAANQSNVRIRFYNRCTASLGGYNWIIDDIAMAELDPVDVSIRNSVVIMKGDPDPDFGGYTAFSRYPVQLADSMWPITFAGNNGATAQNSVVNATIRRGTSVVFNQNLTESLPVNTSNQVVDFTTSNGYVPTATGAHVASFNIAATGDATPANNIDTARFDITDTVLSMTTGQLAGTYYTNSPAATGAIRYTQFVGSQFQISEGKQDTLSSASVIFSSNTTPGSSVSVQVYRRAGTTGYEYVCGFKPKTLTASDISTGTGATLVTKTTTFADPDFTTGTSSFILTGGTYAIVVQGNNVPAASTVGIYTSTPVSQVPGITGYGGASDTSLNNGGLGFGDGTIAVGLSLTPFVTANFGRLARNTAGVDQISAATVGQAFPNPSNTVLNVPFTVCKAANVSVTLSNPMGQVVARQEMGRIAAGQSAQATIATGSLASGIYFYTVDADGQRTTNRVVVAH